MIQDTVIKINNQRIYWGEKMTKQLLEIRMASLDGDSKRHEQLCEDLQTSIIILYRFDSKLRNLSDGIED